MKNKTVSLHLMTGVVLACLVLLTLLFVVPPGKAIPAFSRKYQTSCTTCHNNYPELNDFGEAFKKRGFKFPKDDELFVKQEPVMLGSKAQKEAFPEAVYPGEIPGTIPISFRYEGNFTWSAKQPQPVAVNGYIPRTDLFVPNTFTIISAGSFGPNLSFWIDDDISAGASGANGGLGDAYLKYNDLGHYLHLPKDSLNVKFGQFELDIPYTNARTPYPTPYDVYQESTHAQQSCGFTPQPIPCQTTNNPFTLGSPQRGIEFGGYPNDGNFTWSVAFIDGTGSAYGLANALSTRDSKDVFVHASYKFNLERDPESRKSIQAAGPTGPHDHTSLRVGGFYYHGTNQQNFAGNPFSFTGVINDPFYRAGADIRFRYRSKFELYALFAHGHDSNHFVNTESSTISNARAVTYTGGFVVANFWVYPWLIPYVRYDFVNNPSDFYNGIGPVGPPNTQTRNRVSPGYQILVRANIKIIGEYQYQYQSAYPNPNGTGNLTYRPNSFVTGIDYVF